MSAEAIQLTDNEKIDKLLTKRDFRNIYHQHGAQVNDENRGMNLFLEKILTTYN